MLEKSLKINSISLSFILFNAIRNFYLLTEKRLHRIVHEKKKKYRSTLKINWSFVGDEPRPYFISLFLHLLFLPRPPNIYRKTVIPRLEKYSLK